MAIACFAIGLERLGVFSVALRAIQSARDASRVLRDSDLSDTEKERAVRAASLVLLQCFGSITLRSALAVGASLVPLFALQFAGLLRVSGVNRVLMSWSGFLLASGTVAVLYFVRSRH